MVARVIFLVKHLRLCKACRRKARDPRWFVRVVQLKNLEDVRAEHLAVGGR